MAYAIFLYSGQGSYGQSPLMSSLISIIWIIGFKTVTC